MGKNRRDRLNLAVTVVIGLAAVAMLGVTIFDRLVLPRLKPTKFVLGDAQLLSDGKGRVDSGLLLRWSKSGHRLGPPEAPVRIIEFANVLCGYCAKLHFALDTIRARYPDQVSVTWLHFVPTDGAGTMSAKAFGVALECAAAQERFDPYLTTVFAAPRRLGTRAQILGFAIAAGVPDSARFGACFDGSEPAPKVDAESEEARTLGFPGTPVWFINGRGVLGSPTLDAIDSAVVAELRRR